MKIKVLTNDGVHIHTLKVIVADGVLTALGNPVDAEYGGSDNHKWMSWPNEVRAEYKSCYDDDDYDYGDRLILYCPANEWINCPSFDVTIQELRWCFPDLEVIDALYILDD